jgi:hypothetical protein
MKLYEEQGPPNFMHSISLINANESFEKDRLKQFLNDVNCLNKVYKIEKFDIK